MDRREKHKRRKIIDEVEKQLDVLRRSNTAASVEDAIAEVEKMRMVGEGGKALTKPLTLPQLFTALSKRDGHASNAAGDAADDAEAGASGGELSR